MGQGRFLLDPEDAEFSGGSHSKCEKAPVLSTRIIQWVKGVLHKDCLELEGSRRWGPWAISVTAQE